MTRELQSQLSVLEALQRDNRCTQRDLAKTTGLPLSYINHILKGLIRKEFINVKNLTKKRLLYDLTPKGISEKAHLTIEYLRQSLGSYMEIRNRILDLCSQLKQQGKTRLIVCGLSSEAEIFYIAALETGLDIICVVDDQNIGDTWLKMPIEPIEPLSHTDYDHVIVCDMGRFRHLVFLLLSLDILPEKISLCTGQGIKAVTTFQIVEQ